MNRVLRTVLLIALCCGMTFAAMVITPTKTTISVSNTQIATLQKEGITGVSAGKTVCDTKDCTLKTLAYCETSVKTNTGEPLPTIIFPKCECKRRSTHKCEEWKYLSDTEILGARETGIQKTAASYANKLAKPVKPISNITVVAASDYTIGKAK